MFPQGRSAAVWKPTNDPVYNQDRKGRITNKLKKLLQDARELREHPRDGDGDPKLEAMTQVKEDLSEWLPPYREFATDAQAKLEEVYRQDDTNQEKLTAWREGATIATDLICAVEDALKDITTLFSYEERKAVQKKEKEAKEAEDEKEAIRKGHELLLSNRKEAQKEADRKHQERALQEKREKRRADQAAAAAAAAAAASGHKVKIKAMEVPVFGGDKLKWFEFLEAFELCIHKNDKVDKLEKFNYLRQHLSGEPSKRVNAYPLTAASYVDAVTMLTNLYGDKQRIRRQYQQGLTDMPAVTTAHIPVL